MPTPGQPRSRLAGVLDNTGAPGGEIDTVLKSFQNRMASQPLIKTCCVLLLRTFAYIIRL
jgi:hypothetical protein